MGRRAVARYALAGVAAAILSAGAAFAQGVLEGTVTTPEGKPFPNVCCIFLNKPGLAKPIGPVSTRPDGLYRFTNIEPGVYTIEVRVQGFARQDLKGVRILATSPTKYNIPLIVETKEEVEVIGKQKVVQVTSQHKQTFSPEMISDLPSIGNTFQAVIKQAAGVTITESGEIVIRGAKASETQVRLSNTNLSDPFGIFGNNQVDISTEAIEEIQVTTGSFDASQFGFQGGQVRLIPKQGKNEREGSFGLNYRSSLFDGNGAYGWVRPSQAEFAIYEPSMTLGGPFIRDQFWYFANLVYNQETLPALKRRDKTGEYDPDEYESSGWRTILLRNTYQLNTKNKLSLLYQGQDITEKNFANFFPYLDGVYVPTDSDISLHSQSHAFEFRVESVLGDNTNLESTFSIVNIHVGRSHNRKIHEARVIPCSKYGTLAEEQDFIICDRDEASGPYPNTFTFRRESLQWEERITTFVDKRFGGDHRLFLGVRADLGSQGFNYTSAPVYIFNDRVELDDPQTVNASFAYNQPREDTIRITGLYFQDDLTISPRWNIVFGGNLVDQRYTTFGYRGKPTYDDLCAVTPECPFNGVLDPLRTSNLAEYNRDCLDAEHLLSTDSDTYWNQFGFWRCLEVPAERYSAIGITDVRFLVPGMLNYLSTPEALKFGGANLTVATSVIWKPYGDDDTIVTAFLGRYYGIMGYATGWETAQKTVSASFTEVDPAVGAGTNCEDYVRERDHADCYGTTNYYLFDRNLDIPYTNDWSLQVARNLTDVLGVKFIYTSRRSYKQLFPVNINRTFNADGEVVNRKNKNFRSIYYLSNFETRRYEAFEFHIDKKMSRGWEINSNYTYQQAFGVAEDLQDYESANPSFTLIPETGFLDDDQRHFIKISLLNHFPGQFRLGTIVNWESGLPYSKVYRIDDAQLDLIETYLGLGKNAFRNPSHWRVDLALHKDFTFKKGHATASLELSNVLNEAFIGDQRAILTATGGGGFGFGAGGITGSATGDANAVFVPFFHFGREWQFSFKYKF